MKNVKNLQWSDRLALMEHFQPSDTDASRIFGVQIAELRVARDLQTQGTLVPAADINTNQYADLFEGKSIKAPSKSSTSDSLTTIVRDSGRGKPPLSATKPSSSPKKRGRRGDAIAKAFAAIPTEPTPVIAFAAEHGVSIPVLKQSSRFNPDGEGKVRVKMNKDTGEHDIWRDLSA